MWLVHEKIVWKYPTHILLLLFMYNIFRQSRPSFDRFKLMQSVDMAWWSWPTMIMFMTMLLGVPRLLGSIFIWQHISVLILAWYFTFCLCLWILFFVNPDCWVIRCWKSWLPCGEGEGNDIQIYKYANIKKIICRKVRMIIARMTMMTNKSLPLASNRVDRRSKHKGRVERGATG